ncbi:MAG: polysaccharide biosynthesis/export family protein [Fibrobacter intestinalis]|uniref:Polysaccharide export outer membrane protein n=1 Tax=Fibrobacter intestinalis TaxID=28122 RepID=A0A1T4RVG0_9BACT|nr:MULTISPECIES: polysaccharide biosynthesis/export family protein [Fibrobacter]PBC73389.1 polysaccharide export outer membrane protein [Fibrobacter sp. NR9]SKA19856.1 polysaccharide export outer membrane protein [Fibrobacter intestinalis]
MKFWILNLLVVVSLVLSGCFAAPGMVLNESADEEGAIDTLADFQGAKVHLQSINAKTLALQSSASLASGGSVSPELLSYSPEAYKLGPFDIIQVVIWEHPELTSPLGSYRSDIATGQLVSESGIMFYPYVGDINVLGLTITELRVKIVQELSKVLKDPQIDIRLLQSQRHKIYVQGSVKNPGVVLLSDVPVTLLEAINRCGGATVAANLSSVEFSRDGKNYTIDLLAPYEAGKGPNDIVLKDNDVIRIPDAEESKVYMMGEVGRQQALPLKNGKLSLAQAIAEAGGLQSESAKAENIYVIRAAAMDEINVFHLNAGNPMALVFGDRFALQPGDLVYVDATGLARWNRVMKMLLPTAQLIYYGTQAVHTTHTAKEDLMNW